MTSRKKTTNPTPEPAPAQEAETPGPVDESAVDAACWEALHAVCEKHGRRLGVKSYIVSIPLPDGRRVLNEAEARVVLIRDGRSQA